MRTLPLNFGTVHFVGIGGIGMSGIAEIMSNLGYTVQGSDLTENSNVRRLRALGIKVTIGHFSENIINSKVVVVSSAVKDDNPEIVAARERMLPIVRRAEMLAELMRLKWSITVAGTHGKTTTTSLVAAMLDAAEYDPTVVNGGIINAYGTNARLGAGDWIVVEADESDGSFVKLPATIAVVTNIDPEHLDFYGDFEAEREAFQRFVENLPFYGAAIMCIDHPEVQELIGKIGDRRVITYGFSPQADVRGVDIESNSIGMKFSVCIDGRVNGKKRNLGPIVLPMHGEHNVQNCLAAIGAGLQLGIDDGVLSKAFQKFSGVKRRFTPVGSVSGITIIDDYGHHPVEIAAALRAARAIGSGRVFAVVQPHRYSRLKNLFEEFCSCFNDADFVVVTPVYPAGEMPIEGVDSNFLAKGLVARGHRNVIPLDNVGDLAAFIGDIAVAGDIVLCLGAGSITQWAHLLPDEIATLNCANKIEAGL